MPRIECSKINRGRYYVSRVGQALCADITYRGNPPAEWMVGRNFRPKICDAKRLYQNPLSCTAYWLESVRWGVKVEMLVLEKIDTNNYYYYLHIWGSEEKDRLVGEQI